MRRRQLADPDSVSDAEINTIFATLQATAEVVPVIPPRPGTPEAAEEARPRPGWAPPGPTATDEALRELDQLDQDLADLQGAGDTERDDAA
jgi:hypothetical protein